MENGESRSNDGHSLGLIYSTVFGLAMILRLVSDTVALRQRGRTYQLRTHLPDCGFNVLNWGKQKDIAEVKARVGDRMCLMGNVSPLEVGVRGTPEEVRAATLEVLEKGGDRGLILSVGGGTSPTSRIRAVNCCKYLQINGHIF